MIPSITPEFDASLRDAINQALYSLGLPVFLVLLTVIVILYIILYFVLRRREQRFLTRLDNTSIKDIEIWKEQKKLMFELVSFLDGEIFSTKKDRKTPEEIFSELNVYYGKLYLVMDTSIIVNINKYVIGTVGPVHRYYLYKELRKQLMQISKKEVLCNDFPHIAGGPNALYLDENGVRKKTKSLQETKQYYPFVEEHHSEKGKIKMLPWFSGKEET